MKFRQPILFVSVLLSLFIVNIAAQNNEASAKNDEKNLQPLYGPFNLPLIVINTGGESIPDEPRIRAEMKIINNGEGNLNRKFDPPNEYDGFISIERRGESSSGFPKKSYSLELQLADSSNNNVSVFGFPAENDFVLYAPYSDKTLMRNFIVYTLFLKMKNWAPRTQFVEVILNNDYKGIYVWMEKIKRDENRVDIDKIDSTDTSVPDITGGYLLRRDKTNGMEPFEYWHSPVEQVYYEPLIYQYFDPDYYELTEPQRKYIRDYMQEFDEMMSGPEFNDPDNGYPAYIDEKSFIDMMIVNEFSKGLDCYMFSTYFYKQNDEDGGKFFAGPPWDYNISMDNVNYGYDQNIPYVHSWVYDNWSRVYWWARLMEDEDFEWQVMCRWEELRHGVMSDNSITSLIDNTVGYLDDAIARNFERWPILGTYIWPNSKWPSTYSEEIGNLKSWIEGRLNWIDGEWGGICEYTGADEAVILPPEGGNTELRILPNPTDMRHLSAELKNLPESSMLKVTLYDMQGNCVWLESMPVYDQSYLAISFPDLSYLADGIYLLRISNENSVIATERIVKR